MTRLSLSFLNSVPNGNVSRLLLTVYGVLVPAPLLPIALTFFMHYLLFRS